MRKITTNPSTFTQLAVIEDQFQGQRAIQPQNDAPAPVYHEYYKVEQSRGFVKITLPKQGMRR